MSAPDKVTKVPNEAKAALVAQVSGVTKVSKVEAPVADSLPIDNTIAFKPFENSVYDINGFLRLIDELTLIERSLFRGKEGLISQKAKDFTISNVIFLFEEIEKTGLEPTNDTEQVKFLKDLVAYLKTMPVIKVTIGFEPTNTFLMKINSEVSGAIGRKVILDLVINEYIVGGAVFEYKGKISEQTLDVLLDRVLAKTAPSAIWR